MTGPYGGGSYDDYGGGSPQYGFAWPGLTPVVKQLLIINAGVFLLGFTLFMIGEKLPTPLRVFQRTLGLVPEVWADYFPFVPIWQLLSYGFLHATSQILHLLWNMLLLYFFGTMLEGILGPRRFLVVYLFAMLAGGLLHMLVELVGGGQHAAIGASGAVLGVMVAVAVLRPDTQVILLFVPVKLKWLAVGIVVLDVFQLLVSLRLGAPDFVAHYVHLGGVIYGFAAARRGWIWWDLIEKLQTRRDAARHARRVQSEKLMDDLLAKIHREGLGSLDRREKEFLKRMSSRNR